tara:strand:- start:1547 stop:1846 length:300 start_codon:yes stop_codon:yes gene_type:complete
MIIRGSINHTYSGRKRKVTKVKKAQKPFIPLDTNKSAVFKPAPWAVRDKEFKSAPLTPYKPPADSSYKKEVSKNYTVSIAFNKGAYQVISDRDIEHIGK